MNMPTTEAKKTAGKGAEPAVNAKPKPAVDVVPLAVDALPRGSETPNRAVTTAVWPDLPRGFRMTEIGPLPNDWTIATIGNLFDLQQGRAARRFLRTSPVSVLNAVFSPNRFEAIVKRCWYDGR
jgi:hypothetical protein